MVAQVHRKQYKELCNLQVRQHLEGHDGFIWAMIFSRDGSFLASGGQDQVTAYISLAGMNFNVQCHTPNYPAANVIGFFVSI